MRSQFTHFRIWHVVILLAGIVPSSRMAGADENPALDPILRQAVAEYNSMVSVARERFLPQFDKAIAQVKNNKSLSIEESARLISDWEIHREKFRTDGSVPLDPVILKHLQAYARDVDRAALKLSNLFQKAARASVAEGKVEEANELLKYRDKLIVGEGYELVGHWRLAEGIGAHGYSEQYMIQKRLGQWSVERSFYEPNGRKVGASTSIDLKYSQGVLSYTDHFTRKPKAEWHDKADTKVWADPNAQSTLKLRWVVGSGQSDVNTLVPVN